jgi:hypothetical protein
MSQSSPAPISKSPALVVSDKVYSILKHLAAVGLPAVSTLYVALASVYHWPDVPGVLAAIAALNVFVGGFMTLSSSTYASTFVKYAGDLLISTDGFKTPSLALNHAMTDIEGMAEVLLQVKRGSAAPTIPIVPVPEPVTTDVSPTQ